MNSKATALGSARAESDLLLTKTFLRTADFELLADGTKSFVVGRRGAGKSALYLQLSAELSREPDRIVVNVAPEEYQINGLISSLRKLLSGNPQYRNVRSLMRVVWRATLLTHIAKEAARRPGFPNVEELTPCLERPWLCDHALDTAQAILAGLSPDENLDALPNLAAKYTGISQLETVVRDWFETSGARALVLIDRLDEGWQARSFEGGLIGGLCVAAVDLYEKIPDARAIVFLRDNIFRLLEQWDDDFSRNISGDFLRLTWDHDTLFALVVKRLRLVVPNGAALQPMEVWNRFAQRELTGRDGFNECLKRTLYRPRDALVLFSRARETALRKGRKEIVLDDVENSAKEISTSRLSDLYKEYEDVLPGLRSYVEAFSGAPALSTAGEIWSLLESRRSEFTPEAQQAFVQLGDAPKVFQSLLGVGFLGIEVSGSGFRFCHDGTDMPGEELAAATKVAVHPCYARALDVSLTDFDLLLAVSDDYDEDLSNKEELTKFVKAASQRHLDSLSKIPLGIPGASAFEEWVHKAVTVLWAGDLSNIQLHPNKGAPQRRDIVGANECKPGFWLRMSKSHNALHVIFEAKNFKELDPDAYSQARSYLGKNYGRLIFIVYRGPRENLTPNERSHVQEAYLNGDHLLVLLPSSLLLRWLRKCVQQKSHRYARDHFKKWVDRHEREFIHSAAGRKS